MGTAGTEVRGTAGQILRRSGSVNLAGAAQKRREGTHDKRGGVFGLLGKNVVFAFHGHSDAALLGNGAHGSLEQGIIFFQHEHALTSGKESDDHFLGKRPGHAQLEHADLVLPAAGVQGVGEIVTGNAGSDDAEFRLGSRNRDLIEAARLGNGFGPAHSLHDGNMEQTGNRGHGNEALGLAFKGNSGLLLFRKIIEVHGAAHMADAGGGAEHDRLLQLAGKTEGLTGHVLGFLGRGRLKAGEMGSARVITVVLLILRGMEAGVVSAQHDKAAGQTGIG